MNSVGYCALGRDISMRAKRKIALVIARDDFGLQSCLSVVSRGESLALRCDGIGSAHDYAVFTHLCAMYIAEVNQVITSLIVGFATRLPSAANGLEAHGHSGQGFAVECDPAVDVA